MEIPTKPPLGKCRLCGETSRSLYGTYCTQHYEERIHALRQKTALTRKEFRSEWSLLNLARAYAAYLRAHPWGSKTAFWRDFGAPYGYSGATVERWCRGQYRLWAENSPSGVADLQLQNARPAPATRKWLKALAESYPEPGNDPWKTIEEALTLSASTGETP